METHVAVRVISRTIMAVMAPRIMAGIMTDIVIRLVAMSAEDQRKNAEDDSDKKYREKRYRGRR